MRIRKLASPVRIPLTWIGIEKDWKSQRQSFYESFISLTPENLRLHAHIVGATGTGKTNLIHHLIAQDIILGRSFIIIDLRGDLVNAALALCAGRVTPGRVAYFNLREKNRPRGFNPLSGQTEASFRALAFLEIIQAESDSFGVQLAETLRYATLLLAMRNQPLTMLERLFRDSTYRADLLAGCDDEALVGFWLRYGQMSLDKQNTLSMPVMNKVSILLSSKSLLRTLGHQSPLDLRAHLITPGSVTLASLAADELFGAGRMFGSLLISSICREVFSQIDTPERDRNQIRLYVDEFEHFGTRDFEMILAEGRRFGLSLVLAHQTLAQLNVRARSMILNNVGAKVVFRTGREDGAVLSKDLFGNAKAFDFSSLPTGEAVVHVRGSDPIWIETNAPLFDNPGYLSPETQEYVSEILDLHPRFDLANSLIYSQDSNPARSQKTVKPPPEPSLDDWI